MAFCIFSRTQTSTRSCYPFQHNRRRCDTCCEPHSRTSVRP